MKTKLERKQMKGSERIKEAKAFGKKQIFIGKTSFKKKGD